jgi:hypothetical protein
VPRDASGNTTPLPGTIVSLGQVIQPSQHNPMVEDLYSMMSQSLSRDGQGGMRANLDMGAFQIKNVAAPTLPGDAARKSEIDGLSADIATKAALFQNGTADNTFSDTDQLAYVSGTVQKRGTFSGLISSLFNGARKIANGWFDSTFRLFDATDQTKGLAFNLAGIAAGQTRTITVPDGDVTVPAGVLAREWTTLASVSATTTSVDFTSIPSWVTEAEIQINQVSTSGTSSILAQVGVSGVPITTGYASTSAYAGGNLRIISSAGFATIKNNADDVYLGKIRIYRISGLWCSEHVAGVTSGSGAGGCPCGAGRIALASAINFIRVTTVSGTETFTAGALTLRYR